MTVSSGASGHPASGARNATQTPTAAPVARKSRSSPARVTSFSRCFSLRNFVPSAYSAAGEASVILLHPLFR